MSETLALHLEKYELMLIFFTDLGEETINNDLEEMRQHLTAGSGEIYHEDKWGNRDLAYTIKKQREGTYFVLNFSYPPEKIAELEKNLNINPHVIRYLLIKVPLNYSIKTLADYQDEEAKTIKEEAVKKAEESAKKALSERSEAKEKPAPAAKKVSKPKKTILKGEKTAKPEPVQEESEEVKTPQKAKKTEGSKSKLDELDEKLRSIIDDPDITL